MQIKTYVKLTNPKQTVNQRIEISSLTFEVKSKQPEQYMVAILNPPFSLINKNDYLQLPAAVYFLTADQLTNFRMGRGVPPNARHASDDIDLNMVMNVEVDLASDKIKIATHYLSDSDFELISYQIEAERLT